MGASRDNDDAFEADEEKREEQLKQEQEDELQQARERQLSMLRRAFTFGSVNNGKPTTLG